MMTFGLGTRAARLSALLIGTAFGVPSGAYAQSSLPARPIDATPQERVPARPLTSTEQSVVPAQSDRDAAQPAARASQMPPIASDPARGFGRNVAITLRSMNLERALQRIADREHVSIAYDSATVRTRSSAAVNARSAAQAIQQAVSGTGLSMKTGEHGYIVGEVDETQPGDIVVRARRNEAETSYAVQAVSSATRDGMSLREQPQSTTVVTAKIIADEQTQTITDALRNVSGATVSFNAQGAAVLSVRGFTATPTSGGINTPSGGSQPVANIERVEVLKGPAAILAGSGNLGGIVNIVSKRPVAQPLLNISAEYASYNEKKLTIDGSTPLDPEHKVSARLVLEADDAVSSPADYDGKHEYLIAPSIRFKNGRTDVTLGGQLSDVRLPAPQFGVFLGTTLTAFPRQIGPESSGIETHEQRAWYEASQKIGDWLTLNSRGLHSTQQLLLQIVAPATAPSATNGFVALRTDSQQQIQTDGVDNYARADIRVGSIENTLVLGYNYGRYQFRQFGLPNSVSSIAVISNYLTSDLSFGGAFPPPTTENTLTVQTQNGYYAQDTVKFGPLHVVASVRRTDYTQDQTLFGKATVTRDYRSMTPSFGAVLDILPWASVYANYLRGFTPTFAVTTAGQLLPPTRSQNIEAGLKADFFGSRLTFVGSAYRLRQYDLNYYGLTSTPGVFDQLIIDGLQTRGVDLDLRGAITRSWNIIASASFNDFRYLSPQQAAFSVIAQPKRRASLFTTYEQPSGIFKGLGAGVGVFYISKSDAAFTAVAANRRIVPDQTDVNINLYYTIGRMRLNVGVTNLLDDKLYNVTSTANYVPRQAPRSVRGTLTYSFF